jgi:nucleoside-diphosphate-sugar epimerase
MTQEEFLGAIATEVGGRPPGGHLPYRALYAAGWAAERLATLTRTSRRPPITRLGVAFAGTDSRYAIGKAQRELGYTPCVHLRAGIGLTAHWYLKAGDATRAATAHGGGQELNAAA